LSDIGTLLPILVLHLVLTGLPGVAAVLLAARRGVREVPILLAAGLAGSGLVAALSFWVFYADPVAGKVFAWAALGASLALLARGIGGRWLPAGLVRPLAAPLALWALGSVFVVFLGFAHGGVDSPLASAATRFAGSLPTDNDIPRFYSEWFFLEGHRGDPPVYPAGWLSSDRPPLQIGYVLSQRPVEWGAIGLHYQVLGVVLQQLWIVGLWALLLAARVSPLTRGLTACAALLSGLAIVNGFFVWPKLLPAAFLLAAAAIVLTPLWPGLRRDPRAGALVGALLGLALLGHGASVFGVLPLAAVAAWRGLPSGRWLAAALLAGAILLVPWSDYQEYGDPPGNRTVKWMLAGAPRIDERSTTEALLDGYGDAGLVGTLENKARNLETLTGASGLDSAGRAIDAAFSGDLEKAVRTTRGILFLHLLASLGLLLLALPALAVGWRRGRRIEPEWGFALVCFAVLLLGIIALALLLFGSPPSRAVLHAGSYALPLLGYCGAVAALRAVWPRFAVGWVALAATLMLALYVPAFDPPAGSSYSTLAYVLAAAGLTGFAAVALRADSTPAAANTLAR